MAAGGTRAQFVEIVATESSPYPIWVLDGAMIGSVMAEQYALGSSERAVARMGTTCVPRTITASPVAGAAGHLAGGS